jgi:hypothetical protein
MWLYGKQNITIDTAKSWRFQVRWQQVTAGSIGTPKFSAGLVGIAQDGSTIIDKSGGAALTSSHFAVNQVAVSAGSGWRNVNGYWAGTAATGTDAGTGLVTPGKLQQNVKYVRPLIMFNFGGSDSTQQVDVLSLIDAVDGQAVIPYTITADRIVAGELKTTNYAEDGSGNPTAGAKLDHTGTALKVAPGNLQVGSFIFANMFRRFSCTMSSTAKTHTFTLSPAEPDTNYAVIALMSGYAGSAANDPLYDRDRALNTIIYRVVKDTGSFTVSATTYQTGDAQVTYDVILLRTPS